MSRLKEGAEERSASPGGGANDFFLPHERGRNPHTYMIHTHQGYERYARERVREATAVYFEAQKETRDYDRRQRLSEVSRFYRSLAGIIPAIPPQYKIKVGPSVRNAGAPALRSAGRWPIALPIQSDN